jgi:hypothetical protein
MASGIERSIRRLDGALDALETAVSRLLSAEPLADRASDEPPFGADDESLLDDRLDRAEARAADLERASREASRRLQRAIAALRGVLDLGTGTP